MTSKSLAEAQPQVVEDIAGGLVIGEDGLVLIEIGPLSLSLTGDEADEIAAAIGRVRAQQRAAEGGEVMSIAAASIFGEWDGQRWRFSSEPSPAPHLDEQIMDEGDLRGAPGLVVLFEAETSEPGLCKFGEAIVLDEIDIAFLRLYFPEHPLCQAPVGCRESEEREKQAGFSLRQTDPLDRHLLELLFVRNLRALIADIIGRTAPGQSS